MTRKTHILLSLCLLLVVGYGIYAVAHGPMSLNSTALTTTGSGASESAHTVLGAQTKTSGCAVRGALPDSQCTPGASISTATLGQICKSGYSSSVRNVPSAVKSKVYREYGITSHPVGSYEVDHLVSLELGGSNDIANLWPEAANPTPGFHQKDAVENYLHDQVCSGKIPLADAQQKIATNWLGVYQSIH